MKAPDKIYLTSLLVEGCGENLSKRVTGNDVEYIRKDLLIEWAEAHKVNCISDHYTDGRNDAMDLLIKMLDLL